MSLRIRLILAFFLLSVVPLAAVTFYSYTANAQALRDAALREADVLAGELGQRMELVTAQLSERVEHLMDIAELQAAAEAAAGSANTSAAPAGSPTTVATPVAITQTALTDSIAKSLGEAAMLLNNVELQNVRSLAGRRGGTPPPGTPPPGTPRPPGAPPPPSQAGAAVGAAGAAGTGAGTGLLTRPAPTPPPTPTPRVRGNRGQRPDQNTRGVPPPDAGARQGAATPEVTPRPQGAAPPQGTVSQVPQVPEVQAAARVTTSVDASGKLKIDMGPIRREMFRQILPSGRVENLSPEERQRVAAEINQRMLGIEQGIKIGAAEIQRRAQEAEKAAARTATASKAAPVPVAPVSLSDFTRKATLSGSRIDVKVERNGEIVREMNAEINLPNVLATVFSTTRSDRGELPFAVAKDGAIYTRSEADKTRVAALGDVAKPGGPATARMNDWIVVTTEDKSGSGLRLGIARPVTDSLTALRRTAARNAGLGLLLIAIALVGIVPLSIRLTRNLSVLGDAVSRIAKGDYRARVPVKGHDEVGQLAAAFNKMAADVERHQRTAVEQERIRRELELGRQIQNEMLPHAPLQLGLTQVQGVSVPAREVGGDFFNYFVLDNGHVALLMGDVSGKGVGAALLMANIQAALKVRLGLGQDLSAVADALDRDIDANSPGPVYATLFIGILDPASRRLRYVNAGHNPQFVLHQGRLERMPATGLPVGLLSGRGYTEQSLQLAAGDLLFLYTDGCVEAEDEQDEMYGMERLEQLLIAAALSPNPLEHVEEGIRQFRGRHEPSDDATLMTVQVG